MLDLLLEWCSERVEGSMESFREAHDWLRSRHNATTEWGISLYTLQILGHLEADWSTRRWAVAPTVITVIDDSGGNAALIGARPRMLMRRFHLLQIDSDPRVQELAEQIMLAEPIRQRAAPDAYFMTAPSDEILAELCAILRIRFEHRVAMRIRESLPSLDSYLAAGEKAAAPPGVEMRRLDLTAAPRWIDVDDDDAPGAYEYQGYGAPRYHFVDGAGRYETDKGVVAYAELRRLGKQALYYSKQRSAMYVPAGLRLPLLAARCAVLRTALIPTFDREPNDRAHLGPINTYRNIPPLTYKAICDSVGQNPFGGTIK